MYKSTLTARTMFFVRMGIGIDITRNSFGISNRNRKAYQSNCIRSLLVGRLPTQYHYTTTFGR